jgi:glycosyltransferase involved in cell wall biosynthesis
MQSRPSFSVVIPVHDRAGELMSCLQALCEVEPPDGGFEVIVVDDGSATVPETAAFAQRLNLLRLRNQERCRPAAARNRGGRHARGTHLAFLDADCLPEPGWLVALQAGMARFPEGALLGGCTLDGCPENRYSAASHQILDVVNGFYNQDSDQARFFPATNLAVPAQLFEAAGGFREDFFTSEDREFCDRWLRLGHRMAAAPEARVRHVHPVNMRAFLRRHFGYGQGAYRFHRLRALRDQQGLRLAPPGFYLRLFGHPLAAGLGPRALEMEALVLLSQAASTAGFLWQAARAIAVGKDVASEGQR